MAAFPAQPERPAAAEVEAIAGPQVSLPIVAVAVDSAALLAAAVIIEAVAGDAESADQRARACRDGQFEADPGGRAGFGQQAVAVSAELLELPVVEAAAERDLALAGGGAGEGHCP